MFKSHQWKVMSFPAFRWLAINSFLGFLSIGLTNITLSWIIMNVDDSVSAPAKVMMCLWGPTIVLAPLCGILADHYSRKWIMIFSNAARGILLIGLVMLISRELSSTAVYVIAIALSILGNLYGPAAFAYIRQSVPDNQLLQANVIISGTYELGNVIGMAAAGFLLALSSANITLAISGWLFIAATGCLLLMNLSTLDNLPQYQREIPKKLTLWKNLHEGFSYLAQRKNLCAIYLAQLFLMVNFLTAPILLIPFAKDVLQISPAKFGIIQVCFSVGIVLGGLTSSALVEMFGFKQILLSKTFALALFFACFSVTSSLFFPGLFYLLIGFCLISWTLVVTKAQSLTDISYLARVQSVFNSLAAIFVLAVYLLISLVGNALPMRLWYGLEVGMAALAFYLLWRQRKFL